MALVQPRAIFDAVAVSSTTTYKSSVMTPMRRNTSFTAQITSTAAGDLESEINNRNDQDYATDVAAAGSEAANTSHWVKESMLSGGGNAFLSATPATAVGKLAMAAANSGVAWQPHGPRRRRWTYTNSSGSGVLTVRANFEEI